ncbi:MAG TPA: hypothetical protein VGD69_24865 [Herpetosiphonaceae bacterium]
MADIFVEIRNQGFDTVTILKASTKETLGTINKGGPGLEFKLLDGAPTVTICAITKETATVSLDGVEGEEVIHVYRQEIKDLEENTDLDLHLQASTVLTLQPSNPDANAVKCGEVIIQPPLAQ